jgi:ribosome-associated protein
VARHRRAPVRHTVLRLRGRARGGPLSPVPSAQAPPPAEHDEGTEQLLSATLEAIDEKLGADPVVLEMTELLGVVDLFVVTSGRSDRQVRTITEEVERVSKLRCGRGPIRVEGLSDARWVLLDFGDVVVHVFDEETRSYYDLEHLWSAAPRRTRANPLGGERR